MFDETAPVFSRLEMHFAATANRPAVRAVWRDGGLLAPRPRGLPSDIEWPYGGVGHQHWIGSEGALIADAYGDGIILLDEERRAHFEANPPEPVYRRPVSVYDEWTAAVRSGGRAHSDFVSYSGPFTEMVLLGNVAIRTRQALDIDAQSRAVTNVAVPDELVMPEYRNGWTL